MKSLRDRCRWRREPSGCWRWLRGVNGEGRGYVRTPTQQVIPAYRALWLVFVGPIPDGLDLHHTCEHVWCVNPAHLQPAPRVAHNNSWRRE